MLSSILYKYLRIDRANGFKILGFRLKILILNSLNDLIRSIIVLVMKIHSDYVPSANTPPRYSSTP